MKVSYVTSGFPNGFTHEFIKELAKYLTCKRNFVFVASDFSMHDKTSYYKDLFLQFFKDKGIVFENAFVVDYEMDSATAVSLIEAADVVWLSGGNTLLQMKNIKNYGLIDALQRGNGITIGMSAGAINMAKKVVLAKNVDDDIPELSVYDGIGLVDFNIEPHLNKATCEHIRDVEIAARVSPIYGLHDEAFLEVVDGEMKTFGVYKLFK